MAVTSSCRTSNAVVFMILILYSIDDLPFDPDGLPIDGMEVHPPVDAAAIVADLEPLAVLGLDQMKIIPPMDMDEDHVIHGQVFFLHWKKGN